ncbi:lipopolysaccharide biosynthesis protein [Actinomyces faecalis]|uniref:lipopolysaccharide biosynthesis protein n=1 Tax=Actinomyces faecalis TaxID=2722820 RepID=UPI0015568CC8|nr:lipopolysaccharide biosynthesis protein [Actinomyces faecalis]
MSRSERSQLGRDYLWNSAASLAGSLSLVVMLSVVSHSAGIEAAGIYALAIAVGQQFQTLGMYEVRTYHVTDVEYRFSFGTYLATRILTVALMILGIIVYTVVSSSDAKAGLLIMLVAFLRLFDAFEDVFYSEFQRVGHLDIGGRASFLRTLVTAGVFCLLLLATGDLLVATCVTLAASLVAMVMAFLPPARRLFPLKAHWDRRAITRVLIECLPLFIALFIAMYLANAPRYAIDRFLDSATQGYFAIIYMPAVAINQLSLLVFRPLLTRMATRWTAGDWRGFTAMINRGLRTTLAAFVVVAAVTYVAGPAILQLVFGQDVSGMRPELMVLVAGGAMNSAGVILYYALATMRCQRLALYAYLLAAAVITVLCATLVPAMGLLGASIAYTAAMTLLAALFAVAIYVAGRARKGSPGTLNTAEGHQR